MALSFVAPALVLVGAVIVLIPLYLYMMSRFRRSKNALLHPTEWPILGVLPSVISVLNSHSFHDSVTGVLAAMKLLNFRVHAPPGTGLCYFLTCDPENVRHIFTRSFANYPKGDDFASAFPLLDDTIFTADGEPWRRQRRRIYSVVNSAPMLAAVSRACRHKVARGLVPALARMAATGTAFDAQDVLGRLVFDMTVMLVFGEDPCCLSIGNGSKPPPVPVAAALDALMEVAFFRNTGPRACIGKNIAVEQMLSVAAAVAWNFDVEVVDGHAMVPKLSVLLLQMRNGLIVRVNNRGQQRTPSSS